jgi:hypothetical protein
VQNWTQPSLWLLPKIQAPLHWTNEGATLQVEQIRESLLKGQAREEAAASFPVTALNRPPAQALWEDGVVDQDEHICVTLWRTIKIYTR